MALVGSNAGTCVFLHRSWSGSACTSIAVLVPASPSGAIAVAELPLLRVGESLPILSHVARDDAKPANLPWPEIAGLQTDLAGRAALLHLGAT